MKNGLKYSHDNLQVLGEIIETVRVGMLTTLSKDGIPACRPMYVQEVDEEGNVWFFTLNTSNLAEQVRFNPQVLLSFSDSGKNKYLTSNAIATLVEDPVKMKELWTPMLKAWFPDNLDTPGIILLKVQMQDAEYWDSPSSPVVKVGGIMKALVSKETYLPGRHEHVDLHH